MISKIIFNNILTLDSSSKGNNVIVIFVLDGDDDIQHVDGFSIELLSQPDSSGFAIDGEVVAGNCIEDLRALGVDALQCVDDGVDRRVFGDFEVAQVLALDEVRRLVDDRLLLVRNRLFRILTDRSFKFGKNPIWRRWWWRGTPIERRPN